MMQASITSYQNRLAWTIVFCLSAMLLGGCGTGAPVEGDVPDDLGATIEPDLTIDDLIHVDVSGGEFIVTFPQESSSDSAQALITNVKTNSIGLLLSQDMSWSMTSGNTYTWHPIFAYQNTGHISLVFGTAGATYNGHTYSGAIRVDGAKMQSLSPSFSPGPGFTDDAMTPGLQVPGYVVSPGLEISITSVQPVDAQIRYTLDGSRPTTTSGLLIQSGDTITLTTAATIRAIAFKDDWQPSAPASATYTVPEVGDPKWRLGTGGSRFTSASISHDGTIHTTSSGRLYAINRDGTEQWQFLVSTAGACSPVVGIDGTVYTGSGYDVHAVTPDGDQDWVYSIELGSGWRPAMYGLALASDGTVYATTSRGLYAINRDGTLKWVYDGYYELVSAPPTIGADGTIYVRTSVELVAIEPSSGTVAWSCDLDAYSFDSRPAIGADGTVYISDRLD